MTLNPDFKPTGLLEMPSTYCVRSLRAICLRYLSSCIMRSLFAKWSGNVFYAVANGGIIFSPCPVVCPTLSLCVPCQYRLGRRVGESVTVRICCCGSIKYLFVSIHSAHPSTASVPITVLLYDGLLQHSADTSNLIFSIQPLPLPSDPSQRL